MKELSRKDALDWCVENLIEWPNGFVRIDESVWTFGKHRRDNEIILSKGDMNYITKQDWLEAKAAKDMQEEKWQPEIGRECEVSTTKTNHREHFVKVTLKYADKNLYVLEHFNSKNTYVEYVGDIKFRPLKTQEEIERDELINSGSHIIEMANGSAGNAYKKYVSSLVDAGWRPTK